MMASLGELANVSMSATRLGTYASRLTHTEFQIQEADIRTQSLSLPADSIREKRLVTRKTNRGGLHELA
jgi:hypothetical protein